MPKLADRVLETSVTEGLVGYVMDGAKTGYQSFDDGFNDGDKVDYCSTNGTDWETGIGTWDSGNLTLDRTLVRKSSNANAAVDWSAGLKDVFCTATADAINRKRELIILYRLGL